ncbi:MAG: trigger factor [Alphaproteobacteria bacterium]|jgi:trigger factor|nr:trigger factor [Alphaproteobacteria bacterium]
MEIKELSKEGLKRSYSVSISAAELEAEKAKKLQSIAKKATIDGFRAGKAPLDKVEAQFGNKVIPEVLEDSTNNAVDKIYADFKIESVSAPKVNVKDFSMEKGLELTVDVELFPEIKEVDFSKITLNKKVVDVSEKEINESLEQMANYYKSFEDITAARAAKSGDVVVIDFVGKVDGVEFDGGKGDDFPLELGSNMFIPGFEEQLLGKKVGEKAEVKVPFPADYHAKHLAGKDSIFEVSIKKMQQVKKAPIDDELAKKSGFNTLAELKADIVKKYQEHAELLEKNVLKKQLIAELQKTADFEMPATLLENEKEALWKEFQHFKDHMKAHAEKGDMAAHGHGDADMLRANKSDADAKAEQEVEAKKRIKIALLFNSIASKNAIKIEDKDIQEVLSQEAMMYGRDVGSMVAYYQNDKNAMRALQSRALENKIMSFMLDKVKFNESKISFEDYTKELQNN